MEIMIKQSRGCKMLLLQNKLSMIICITPVSQSKKEVCSYTGEILAIPSGWPFSFSWSISRTAKEDINKENMVTFSDKSTNQKSKTLFCTAAIILIAHLVA